MNLRDKRGITLIALIVTIIVLIIIAGISIATLTADNGILRQTNAAKVTQIEGTAREQVKLACSAVRLAVADAQAKDNSYSAKANSSAIQKTLINVLEADKKDLTGSFSNGGTAAGDDQEEIIIVYEGEDYTNATNNTAAKITYTIGLSQKTVALIDEENVTLKDQHGNDVVLDIGGNIDTGEGEEEDGVYYTDLIDDSWEKIIEVVESGKYKERYAIGAYKPLDLGSEGIINMQIVDFDVDTLADNSGNARISWVGIELLKTKHNMNNTSTNAGGWAASGMRQYLKNTIKPLVPDPVKSEIVEVTKTYYDYDTSSTKRVADDLWIPSRREAGRTANAEDSGPIYTLFYNDYNSLSKPIVDTTGSIQWWTRTAYYNGNSMFYNANGFTQSNGSANSSYGVALGFCF